VCHAPFKKGKRLNDMDEVVACCSSNIKPSHFLLSQGLNSLDIAHAEHVQKVGAANGQPPTNTKTKLDLINRLRVFANPRQIAIANIRIK
jgi:hypothetical protein